MENQFLDQFAQKTEMDEKELMNSKEVIRKEKSLPWYLFYSDSKSMQVFKSILGLLLFIQFLWLSFVVSLDEAIPIEFNTGDWTVLVITEILFAIDFFINFFTVPNSMRNPTLGNVVRAYLKSWFVIDLIATVISNMLFLFPGTGPKLWRIRLKTSRIFHLNYIRFTYKGIIEYMSARIPKIGKVIQYCLGLIIEMTLWLHLFTCIWIKLGSLDAYEGRGLDPNVDEEDKSWMFRVESDFTSSASTIYEQLTDKESPYFDDLRYLYIYSIYFVLTVLTTVGYGHATYAHPNEQIYIIVLEAISAVV